MIWLLVTGIILAVLGSFTAGVASGPWVRNAWWSLGDWARGPAPSRVPVHEAAPVPDHPRFGPLLDTPPEGVEVTRDDGVLSVRADLPARRKFTDDHAPTGPFAAVPYAPPPASWAQPPPTIEELRKQYDSWQETAYARPGVTESVTAWRPQDDAGYGVDRCEVAVDEAQRLAAGLIT